MTVETERNDLVPPDGGWGWIICIAYALNNIVVLPLISNIGLIFKETFIIYGIDNTLGLLIISFNYAIGMLFSFFGGPLLKRFGYRKVAISGSLFVAFGVVLTSFATSFWTIFLAYSIMSSIGIALVMSSFTFAINCFFKEKRSKAIGLGMSMTGLGQILMPLLIKLLLREYTPSMALLILGGMCFHSFAAALLLRPVKRYMKQPDASPEEAEPLQKNDQAVETLNVENENKTVPKIMDITSLEAKIETKPDKTTPSPYVSNQNLANGQVKRRWFEADEINLGSSADIFEETLNANKEKENANQEKEETKNLTQPWQGGKKRNMKTKIVEFFHLELLKDSVFVNILVGLSLVNCADINFSATLPFIFKDFNFTTDETANLVAIIASCDVLFRFLSPFIGDWCNKGPRVMFLLSLLIVIFARTTLLFAGSYVAMIFVALTIGIAKGIRSVYVNIIIPSYISIEMLPFASGIQQLVNGMILLVFGPAIGKLRDSTGSYVIAIILINIVTMLTIFMWVSEFIFVRKKNSNNIVIEEE